MILEPGQHVQLLVTEVLSPGADSVTTLLLLTVVQTVLVLHRSPDSATLTLAKVRSDFPWLNFFFFHFMISC